MVTHIMNIGIIGVGLVGTALAERLVGAGRSVVGFDVDRARMAMLTEIGGQAAASAAEVVSRCDICLLALLDSKVTAEVATRLHAELQERHVLVDLSTGDPDVAVQLASQFGARGVMYADAPLSGSSEQIRKGEAIAMVGCAAWQLERIVELLDLIAADWVRVGEPGSGQKAKLATNVLLGLNRAALAEALAFAEAIGLDGHAFIEIARITPAYSRAIDAKGERMVTRSYIAESRISQHRKDLDLILAAARQVGRVLPLTETHAALLDRAIASGYGDLDNAAIVEVLRAPQSEIL